MERLDPLSTPLQGLVLIEASAGTGKTYTIASLYLRLMLERGLDPEQILVVTFTQAATEELRERIRKRLNQALAFLRGEAGDSEPDPLLQAMLQDVAEPAQLQDQLEDALSRMDQAAIHTIHGFCQRVLQDAAFDSGSDFEADFITDESHLQAIALADFWRGQVAGANDEKSAWVLQHWSGPQALMDELKATLSMDDLEILPRVDEQILADLRSELQTSFETFRSDWPQQAAEVRGLLEKSPALNRRSYNKRVVANALAAADLLAGMDTPPASLPKDFARLSSGMLAEKGQKPDQPALSHPLFDLCRRLVELLPALANLQRALFLTQARQFIRRHLADSKRDQGVIYFDDLLRRLDQALAGPAGDALAKLLRQRYPAALIDEFQDTDPQQYRIFRRIYAGHQDCGLYLIGDPKQAIYAFRGADIFTYMQAREDVEAQGRQFTLGTNWRSSSALIEGINSLFGYARAPFIYEQHIVFQPVDPGPKADEEPLLIDGAAPVPLQFWLFDDDFEPRTRSGHIPAPDARQAAARACAGQIARLLQQAADGQATIGGKTVKPADIALLVRSHSEGDLMQQALRERGVNSVSLSRQGVFQSEEALELLLLLQALSEPGDESLLRGALATLLLGQNCDELQRLSQDEAAWENRLADFQHYRDLWRQRGFMAAFQDMLGREKIAPRLLALADGERRLTNLLQLAELLQIASRELSGREGLLRWFADQIGDESQDETRQLRLESDEGLVKIVTMHKSKGLEFPLVFVPFPWGSPRPASTKSAFFHHPSGKQACLDLGSEQLREHLELAATEDRAESLRLLYVALTRASRLCVLCWGRINGAEKSALAYLLHQLPNEAYDAGRVKALSDPELRTEVENLAANAPTSISVRSLPDQAPGLRTNDDVSPDLAARDFKGRIDTAWRISSYSGLVRGIELERPDHDAQPDDADSREPAVDPVFQLPAGAHVGHLLHEILEKLDFTDMRPETLEAAVRQRLSQQGPLQPREPKQDWSGVICTLINRVLDTPLDAESGLRLRELTPTDRLNELEFHFPLQALTPARLLDLLADEPDYADSARGLNFEPLAGLMRGFIDLIIRHQGRYYVLDYKSNLLGGSHADYGRNGMQHAIRGHRYDLQYLIYTLALHRLLQQRLPDYDYERHIGGIYYLFLRGMRPEDPGGTGVWFDRPAQRLIEAMSEAFATLESAHG